MEREAGRVGGKGLVVSGRKKGGGGKKGKKNDQAVNGESGKATD